MTYTNLVAWAGLIAMVCAGWIGYQLGQAKGREDADDERSGS